MSCFASRMKFKPFEILKNQVRDSLINFANSAEKYVESERILQEILQKYRNDSKAMLSAARLCIKNKNLDEAKILLDICFDLDQEDKNVLFERGRVYSRLGKHREAEKMFIKHNKLDPNFVYSVFERGNLYADKEHYEKAKKMFEKCIEIDKDNLPSRFALARIFMVNEIRTAEYYRDQICQIDSSSQYIEYINKRINQIMRFNYYREGTIESAIEHIKKHEENDINKELYGVFNKGAVEIFLKAWHEMHKVTPKRNFELYIYDVPCKNAGYMGGSKGNGERLDFVTIITIVGTDFVVSAFPSTGSPKYKAEGKVQISENEYSDILLL